MIVRWGLDALSDVLGGRRAFLLATERWQVPVHVVGRWSKLPTEQDSRSVTRSGARVRRRLDDRHRETRLGDHRTAARLGSDHVLRRGVDGLLRRPQPDRRMHGGGAGAHNEAIVYDVDLTMDLPREVSGGTALNALAHCCEALYVKGRDPSADPLALEGADAISSALPRVLDDPGDRGAREDLLRGAAKAGEALARSGLALGHAMAQAIGGRYGLPHGALNALCLPPALRFNGEFVPAAC